MATKKAPADQPVNIQKYREWYEQTYKNIISLSKIQKFVTENQKQYPQITYLIKLHDGFVTPYSSLWRHESLANIKYLASVKKSEYITTIFKIHRHNVKLLHGKDASAIYAILYTSLDGTQPTKTKTKTKTKKESIFNHEYVSHSPTYKSSDGEYRHRFIPVKQILMVRDQNKEYFEKIESHILEQIDNGDITIECLTYFKPSGPYPSSGPNPYSGPYSKRDKPDRSSIISELQKSIDSNRFAVIFYALSWRIEYKRLIKKIYENHILQEYHLAMFSKQDDLFWKQNEKYFSQNKEQHARITVLTTNILQKPDQRVLVTECGQKIIPLTIKTIENPNDIRLPTWREIFITSLVGNLVINGISPSFPILGDWFFITGSDSRLYDNKIYQVRANHSEIASGIVKGLEQNRQQTFIKDTNGAQTHQNNEIYLSYKMENLSETIKIPMDFAEQELVLAKYAACSVIEHLGRTLADLPILLLREENRLNVGPIFQDYSWFCRYLFELIYGLWCFNFVLNGIHGDLHLNNITTFHSISTIALGSDVMGKVKVPNPHIIYSIRDDRSSKDKMFIFPHRGRFIALIDFSRGFLWKKDILISRSIDLSKIQDDYKSRIYNLFEQEMPDFVKDNATDLRVALEKSFDQVYRVAESLDLYKFTNEYSAHIRLNVLENPKNLALFGDSRIIQSKMLPLLAKIRKHLFNFVHIQMDKIFKNPNIQIDQILRPNLEVLNSFFTEFQVENNQPEAPNLIDFFADSNPLIYDINMYDKFPETITFEKTLELNLTMDEARMTQYKSYEQYLKSNPPQEKIEIVAQEVKDERPQRRGELSDFEQSKEKQKDKKDEKQQKEEKQTKDQGEKTKKPKINESSKFIIAE